MKPPKFMQDNAKKALKCIKEGSDAMTKIGRERAKQIAKGEQLTIGDLMDINSFRRHKQNAAYKGNKCKDKGAVAWLGWGNSLKKGKGVPNGSNWARRQYK